MNEWSKEGRKKRRKKGANEWMSEVRGKGKKSKRKKRRVLLFNSGDSKERKMLAMKEWWYEKDK